MQPQQQATIRPMTTAKNTRGTSTMATMMPGVNYKQKRKILD
jgi:hypothetical protein